MLLCCLCVCLCVCCFHVVEINWNLVLPLRVSLPPPLKVRAYLNFPFHFVSCRELIILGLPHDGSPPHRVPPSLLTQEGCLPTTSPPMMTHTELNSLLFITSHKPSSPAPLFISPDLLYRYSAVRKNLDSHTFSVVFGSLLQPVRSAVKQ